MNGKIEQMFSIFQKKTYLTDLLEGFTDFHNHILPGIDDGAQDIDESLELISGFKDLGVKALVATPHVMGEYYPNTPKTINGKLELLKEKSDKDIQISAAAEYMMDQHFVEIIENNDILTISDNKVLVEMSYFQAPINLNEILFKLQNNSYSPILAHPERYAFYHGPDLEKYQNLKSRGCYFQLNMLSLLGHYGINIQKTAFSLLENNMIDFISSDAHKDTHIEKIREITIKKKHVKPLEKVISDSKELFPG